MPKCKQTSSASLLEQEIPEVLTHLPKSFQSLYRFALQERERGGCDQ